MRSRTVFSRVAVPALGGAAAALAVIVLAAVVLVPQLCEGTWQDNACVSTAPRDNAEDLSTVFEVTAKEPDIEATTAAPPVAEPQPATAAQLLQQTFGSLSGQTETAAVPAKDTPAYSAAPQRLVVKSVPVGADGKPVAATAMATPTALPTPAPLVVPESVTARDPAFSALQVAVPDPALAVPDVAAPVPLTRPSDLDDDTAPSDATRRTIGAGGVNVRSGPSGSEARLYALAPGATVTVVGKQGGWLKVRDDEGRTGWVDQDYVH